ncbi:hypothetical protein DICPUDRAFT_156078 [Dictyostelium purpureum]|uniref:FNIP repeat-containing protein n=1 Tax=Dictyostelium purpureum TaxID=5786 RepID=F0ZVN0_DICPU|nr:uncharacterized protein DICPUDRAFT_156078 [Dictyostelium purpureum]EGC32010.1 hypothetical protein DICPUDRAFT_156078 [Dictyostelium purpureum]|eukprot:XP_003291466.1 hypothetical protein DICPUDRAFT_156078 [Dictyostelium purpureum]
MESLFIDNNKNSSTISTNNNNSTINNNNRNNNNIDINIIDSTVNNNQISPKLEILFYKCWHNIIIRNNIFSEQTKLKKIYLFSSSKRFSFNANTLLTFKYREYLKTIHLASSSYEYDPFDLDLVEYKSGKIRAPFIRCNDIIPPNYIPESVDKVIVDSNIIEPRSLPETITSLIFNCKCNINEMYLIPQSVKTLEINFKITEPLKDFTLPEGLETLKLVWFNQPLQPKQIPDSLKELSLGVTFDQILKPGTFGDNSQLESLEFGYDFNKPILLNVLPKNLKVLKLGQSFKQIIKPGVLPDSLRSIVFRNPDYNIYNLPKASIPSTVVLIHHGGEMKSNQL